MGNLDESLERTERSEPFKSNGLESMVSEIESRCPEDEFSVRDQRSSVERRQIACESRVLDEILSAACDCHGDSCCC